MVFLCVNVDFNYFLKFSLDTYSGIRTKIQCMDFLSNLASPSFANYRFVVTEQVPLVAWNCFSPILETCWKLLINLTKMLSQCSDQTLTIIEFLNFVPSLLEKQIPFIFLLVGMSLRTFGFHLCSHRNMTVDIN